MPRKSFGGSINMPIVYPKPTVGLWAIYIAIGNPKFSTIFGPVYIATINPILPRLNRAVHITSINPMPCVHVADPICLIFARPSTDITPRLRRGSGCAWMTCRDFPVQSLPRPNTPQTTIPVQKWIQQTLLVSLCQRNPKCTSNCRLVDCQVRLSVINTGTTEHGLHRLNIACCHQYLGR